MAIMQSNQPKDWKRHEPSRSAEEFEAAIEQVLQSIDVDDPASANKAVENWSPEDLADLIIHMPLHLARTFLDWLPRKKASRVLADMHWNNRATLSRSESERQLGELFKEMPTEAALETFRSLPKRIRGRMANLVTDLDALHDFHKYPEGTAGSIMDRRLVMVPIDTVASEAMASLRTAFELKGTVGTVFVDDATKTLVGIFRPRDLLAVPPDMAVRDIM